MKEIEQLQLERGALTKEQIFEQDGFELREPLSVEGQKYNWIKKTANPKPIHRIKAVKYSKEAHGFECQDAVIASFASQLCVLCNKEDNHFTEEKRISADYIVENIDYEDFSDLTFLVGKRVKT